MKNNIVLTEKQLNKVMKTLMEDTPGVDQFQKGQYQNYKSQDFKATGSDLFKIGEDQINPNNYKIIDLLTKLQTAVTKSGTGSITVTVNGGASNTGWGNNAAGSPEALKKNKELAQKRLNNLITYFKSKINSPFVTFVPGSATVGKLGSKTPDNDQFVSVSISGKGADGKINVDRDNTSNQYNIYNKKQKTGGGGGGGTSTESRICTRIPSEYTKELKVVIYNWGKTKGLKLPISDKIL